MIRRGPFRSGLAWPQVLITGKESLVSFLFLAALEGQENRNCKSRRSCA